MVQISGIIRESSKIGFKTAEINMNGKYVVNLPLEILSSQIKSLSHEKIKVVGRVFLISKDQRIFINAKKIEFLKMGYFEKNIFLKIIEFFESQKNDVKNSYYRLFPKDEGEILSGIILGETEGVSKDLLSAFQKTGTLHLFAASGMNLVMFCGFILVFLNLFVKKRRAILLSMAAAIFYVFLVGFSPSILRAALMFIFVNMAQVLGRPTRPFYALFVAGGVLLFATPEILTNLGFQLSVMSTLGLIALPEKFKMQKLKYTMTMQNEKLDKDIKELESKGTMSWRNGRLRRVKRGFDELIQKIWGVIRADFVTSSACFLFTFPLIVFAFGQINVMSILVNSLVIWCIDAIMLFGVVTYIFFKLLGDALHLTRFVIFLTFPVVNLFKRVVIWFSNFDVGVTNLVYGEETITLAIFCLIIWVLFLLRRQKRCEHNRRRTV